jgi:oxygen-independent coproporphyrinogen-3 oxidase
VYFGGGTPSYLSVPQLQELTSRMKELIPWDEAEEVAFEAEPGTLNEKKLEALREIGVTRLSLGVEHFDDHILESNGRAHRSGEVDRAYNFARGLGFEHINIDLIAGMMNDTEELWKKAVARAVEMQPDCLTIYQMEVPHNTGIYKQMQADGKVTAPVADWETKRAWVSYAFDEFVKSGYTVTSAYTVVKDPSKIKFVYRDSLWEGSDLLPLGVASFGHLGGIHLQNQADMQPYIETIERGESAIFRAYATSPEERFIREFILKLKLGASRPSYYQKKFGEDVTKRFAPQLHWMQEEGFMKLGDDRIELTRDGLLQVDRLLHEFFLPHHRSNRYT